MQVNVARALLPRPPLPSALPSQPTPLTVRILPTVTVVVTASGKVTLHRSLRCSRAPRPTCRVPAVQPEAARAARRDTLPRCHAVAVQPRGGSRLVDATLGVTSSSTHLLRCLRRLRLFVGRRRRLCRLCRL